MLRNGTGKVVWLLKGAALFWGAVLTLALVFGVASMALGANGGNFILGRINTATAPSVLKGDVNGAAVQIQNTDTGTDDAALNLSVQKGETPLRVNSSARVPNLNADKLDSLDSSAFATRSQFGATQVIRDKGPLPLSGTFTSHGGTLVVTATGSGFRSSANAKFQGNIGMWVNVLGSSGNGSGHRMGVHANQQNSHQAFVSEPWVIDDLPAGTYTVELEAAYEEVRCNNGLETDETYCTTTDQNDPFYVTVVELPK